MILNEQYLKSAHLEIFEKLGFDFELSQLDEILIQDDEDFHREESSYYNEGEEWDGYGLDTYGREVVCNTISMKFVGMPIPVYGDTEKTRNEFIKALEKSLTEFYENK